MEQLKVIEGNKAIAGNRLIAKFAGYEKIEDTSNITDDRGELWLKSPDGKIIQGLPIFDKDWNLLMPVVEKIRNDHFVIIEMYGNFVCTWITKDRDLPRTEKIYSEHTDAITSIYGAVIQYITWYNTNNK